MSDTHPGGGPQQRPAARTYRLVGAVASVLEKALTALCVLALAAMVVLVAGNAIMREAGSGISWAGEASVVALTVSVFLGAAIAYRAGVFPAFTSLRERLKGRARLAIDFGLLIVELLAFGALAYVAYTYARSSAGQVTPALHLDYGTIYLTLPIGAVLLCFFALEKMMGVIAAYNTRKRED